MLYDIVRFVKRHWFVVVVLLVVILAVGANILASHGDEIVGSISSYIINSIIGIFKEA